MIFAVLFVPFTCTCIINNTGHVQDIYIVYLSRFDHFHRVTVVDHWSVALRECGI